MESWQKLQGETVDVLPMQFFDARRKLSAEERLGLAILTQAIREFDRYRNTSVAKRRARYRAARRYLFVDESHWPLSFVALCSTFGLDAGSIRSALLDPSWTFAREFGPAAVLRQRPPVVVKERRRRP